jgi:predicted nucleic acid-binding protein
VALDSVYLVDTSALARLTSAPVAGVLEPLFAEGRIATCGVVDLEMLWSARNKVDLVATRQERRALIQVAIQPADFERAMDVMELLAERGQHRSARLPDLLVAAAAERADLCVMHYDQDFDRIADVTGQAVRWIVPRGSL